MEEPNLVEKAKTLVGAVTNWAVNDQFQKVTNEQFWHRKQYCLSCPFWNAEGFGGLGQCKKCGCSVAKLYIPSSVCPDKRWLSISVSYTAGSGQ